MGLLDHTYADCAAPNEWQADANEEAARLDAELQAQLGPGPPTNEPGAENTGFAYSIVSHDFYFAHPPCSVQACPLPLLKIWSWSG